MASSRTSHVEDPMEIQDLSTTNTDEAEQMKHDLVPWVKGYLGDTPDPAQRNRVSFTCEIGPLGRGFAH